MARSSSRERFVRLAEARTTKVLHMLDLLGNLANRSNYSYSDEDVRTILNAINGKVRELEQRFEAQCGRHKKIEFKLGKRGKQREL